MHPMLGVQCALISDRLWRPNSALFRLARPPLPFVLYPRALSAKTSDGFENREAVRVVGAIEVPP